MDPYVYKSPIRTQIDEDRLRVGVEMLERLDAIRQDYALVGVSAVISLIQALIAGNSYLCRDELIRQAAFLCRADMGDTVIELVDHFAGDDPRRHLWAVVDGFYREDAGPYHDFPN